MEDTVAVEIGVEDVVVMEDMEVAVAVEDLVMAVEGTEEVAAEDVMVEMNVDENCLHLLRNDFYATHTCAKLI